MNASQTIVIFICRDCGATFGAHEVTVPDTESRSDEKVSIDENKCPDCRGILDVRFSESPPAEE